MVHALIGLCVNKENENARDDVIIEVPIMIWGYDVLPAVQINRIDTPLSDGTQSNDISQQFTKVHWWWYTKV